MLEHSPFDACTNTGAETTVSKCFDAISQQSVKQKTFVAFYTVHGKKTVSTQKDAEISQQEPSLFVDATPSPACLSQAERESNTHISSVKDRRRRQVGGGGRRDEGGSDGSSGALWSAVSEGHARTKGVHGF